VDFNGPVFMACYIGLSAITLGMLLWCAFNQRWARIKDSTVSLQSPAMEMNGGIRNSAIMGAKKRIAMMKNGTNEAGSAANDDLSKCNEWTQTGYKSTVVGMTLYALVVLAFWIIQFLLFALTVEYCEFLLFLVFRSPEIHHAEL